MFLVVTRIGVARWYFESPDNGITWVLAKLEQVKRPGLFTNIEYTNGLVTKLVYPNGACTEIEYENFLPSVVKMPWGETTWLTRNKQGFITQITTTRKNKLGKDIPVGSFRYQYNEIGQLVGYSENDKIVYNIERQSAQDANGSKVLTTILRAPDGSFRAMLHKINHDSSWELTELNGEKDQSIQTARLSKFRRLMPIGKQHRTIARAVGTDGIKSPETSFELDRNGGVRIITDAINRLFQIERNVAGRPTLEVLPDGARKLNLYNNEGLPIRKIDSKGQETVLEYDDCSRLIQLVTPSGSVGKYKYNSVGNLVESLI
jgi:YD repeat-containing protein